MPPPKRRTTGRPVGRPPRPAGVESWPVRLPVTAAQRAQIEAAADGAPVGAWIVRQIEAALARESAR